jgi:hypothetical protein
MEVTPEMAVRELACHLYEEMERLDPGSGSEYVNWGELHESNRIFYIECIHALITRSDDLIRLVLSNPDHNSVIGGSVITK